MAVGGLPRRTRRPSADQAVSSRRDPKGRPANGHLACSDPAIPPLERQRQRWTSTTQMMTGSSRRLPRTVAHLRPPTRSGNSSRRSFRTSVVGRRCHPFGPRGRLASLTLTFALRSDRRCRRATVRVSPQASLPTSKPASTTATSCRPRPRASSASSGARPRPCSPTCSRRLPPATRAPAHLRRPSLIRSSPTPGR
jgi:hypothetical protein